MKHSVKISKKEPFYSFSLDERGEAINDYSGNGNVIAEPLAFDLASEPRRLPVVPGVMASASTQSYELPHHPAFAEVSSLFELGTFSVEFWYNAESNMMFNSRNFYIQSGVDGFNVDLKGDFSDLDPSQPRRLFDWPAPTGVQHLVLTNNNREFELFLNGVSIGSVDIQGIQNNVNSLGGTGDTGLFSGMANSVSLYSRALSQQEIQENFLEGSPRPDVSGVTRPFEGTVFSLGLDQNNCTQVWGLQESIAQGDLSIEDAQVVTTAPPTIQMNSSEGRIVVVLEPSVHQGREIFVVSRNSLSYDFDGVDVGNGELYTPSENDVVQIEIKPNFLIEPLSDIRVYLKSVDTISSSGARNISGDITHLLDTRHPLEFDRTSGVYVLGELKLTEVSEAVPTTSTPSENPEDVYDEWGEDNTVVDPDDANVPPGDSPSLPPAPVITPPAIDPPPVYESITQTPLSSASSTANIRTIEVISLAGEAFTVNVGGTPVTPTIYINGISGLSTGQGDVSIIHLVLPANATTQEVSIDAPSGRHILGLVTYPTALSAGNIARLYSRYSQTETINADTSDGISIEEASNTVENYSFAWSNTTAS